MYIVGYAQQLLDASIQPFCRDWIEACNQHRGDPSPQYEEFVEAFLKTALLTEVYKLANAAPALHQVFEAAKDTSILTLDVPSKIGEQYDLIAGCKNLVDAEVVQTQFLPSVPQSAIGHLAHRLLSDEADARAIRNMLLDARRCAYFWEGLYRATYERTLSWWRSQQQVVQHCFFTIVGEPQAEGHYKALMDALQRIVRKHPNTYRLPADHEDEIESVLNSLIGEQTAPPSAGFDNSWQKMRTVLQWVDSEGKWLIPNILQGLQKLIRDQHAQKRQADVIVNREYLDAENEDGRSYYDILAEEYPESGLAVDHEETSEEELLFQFRSKLSSLTATQWKEIENILSEGAFRKREEIGERKFKVMEIWVQDPTKTDLEIAVKLGLGEESRRTIANDRADIEQKLAPVFQMVCG